MKILEGDCLEVMAELEPDSVDSIVTDPPYGLGFMDKKWDAFPPGIAVGKAMLRVLKPGGYILAFGGSRTYHRLACAVEDAGFEIRDQIMWVYGSGFPKSHNIGKAIDKAAGAEREVVGTETRYNEPSGIVAAGRDERTLIERKITAPATEAAKQWNGWGTALKPAHEPIVLARKPLSEKTVAKNVLKWGTGGINVDGCRVPVIGEDDRSAGNRTATFGNQDYKSGGEASGGWTPNKEGRFPANFIHDGSKEVVTLFPERAGNGPASRLFYCPKPNKEERGEGNTHPTVKPITLMRYLCRLITPPKGTVLDPFMGSGTTLLAASIEGFKGIGIEREVGYIDIAKERLLRIRPPSLFDYDGGDSIPGMCTD